MSLKLNEIPYKFGWDLVLFEFGMVELESKVVQGPSEANFEVFEVEDESSVSEGDSDELLVTREKSVLAATGPEPGSVLSSLLPESKIREDPGSNPFKCQPEPFPVYEERMDESEKVGDVDVRRSLGPPLKFFGPKPFESNRLRKVKKRKE